MNYSFGTLFYKQNPGVRKERTLKVTPYIFLCVAGIISDQSVLFCLNTCLSGESPPQPLQQSAPLLGTPSHSHSIVQSWGPKVFVRRDELFIKEKGKFICKEVQRSQTSEELAHQIKQTTSIEKPKP